MINKIGAIMDKNIRMNGICIFVCSIIYIYISIIIFLIGVLKPIISIPVTTILFILIIEYIKHKKKKFAKIEPIYINLKMLIVTIVVVCGIGWALGWTGQSKQTGDWVKHNSTLIDLIERNWPVYYENGSEKSMLSYYLGQYMVPSIIGKITDSVKIAQVFNGLWAVVGLLLAVVGIFKITKSDNAKKQSKALFLIFIFSVCMSISQALGKLFIDEYNIVQGNWLICNEDFKLQYSSNIVLLRWVMPQVIVPWIVMTILYDDKYDIKHYVLLCLPVMFYSSLAFIGLIIYLIVIAIIYITKNRNIKEIIKNIFSLSNICTSITLGVIFILYFIGNITSEKPEDSAFQFVKYNLSNILIYIFFIISFLPYTIVLYKNNKNNIFYWVSTSILLLLPFLKMGYYNDLCMRCSIIPLFIYMVMSIELLNNKDILEKYKKAISILFIIGSFTSIIEFSDVLNNISLKFTVKQDYTLEDNANRNLEIRSDFKYNYYIYDIESNIFYKYLARTKINE